MKRKHEEGTPELKKDKLRKRKSFKKKKKRDSTSTTSTEIEPCVLPDAQCDNLLDITQIPPPDYSATPPPLKPRTSSLTNSTKYYMESAVATPPPPPPPKPRGRGYTVSVAIPGSICDNAQSPELRSYLAGQVARALSIFNVDEVVIFNDNPGVKIKGSAFEGVTKKTNPNIVLARILQYLETPQYLRKALFPVHPDLKYAGLLNPLDCPHHMRANEKAPFREGVVLKRPVKKGRGSFVDCGIDKEVQLDREITAGTRVTVRMESYDTGSKYYRGTAISPDTPRTEQGLYWGYRVRLADTLSAAFTECPYSAGYDMTIGTSDTGTCIDNVEVRHFSHCLIFLGGLQGLEPVIESDESLSNTSAVDLFDYYLNTCPDQGSRTIRTEEALFITLSSLRQQLTAGGMTK